MRLLLLALLLAASCKHSSSSSASAHTETSTVTDSTSSETGAVTTTTTQTEGPSETTITVREYDAPSKEEAVPLTGEPPQGSNAGRVPVVANPTLPRRGPLRKETVTVAKSGGEKTETVQQATTQAQGASEVKAQGKADVQAKAAEASSPSVSCVSLGWLWGLALIAALVIGWRVLRKG